MSPAIVLLMTEAPARIDQNFEFAGKLIDRDELVDGGRRFLKARMQESGGP